MTEDVLRGLVRQASEGDLDALQTLVVHYHFGLHRAVEQSIGSKFCAHLDAEDVLQEAYVTAVKKVGEAQFAGPPAFYRWLETIAVNQVRTEIRGLRRQKRDVARRADDLPRPSTSYVDLFCRLTASDSTPSGRLARHEATAAVLAAMARLTDDQRAVVRMVIIEDRPGPEVAAILSKSDAAVHMLCHRGLKELRRVLHHAAS